MELIGMLDSPYVRRTAISLRLLGIPFTHRSLSVFRHFDEFEQINPLVKAPTLVLDDGSLLTESNLIIDWAQARSDQPALMPTNAADQQRALRLRCHSLPRHRRPLRRRDAGWHFAARAGGQNAQRLWAHPCA